MDKQFIPVLLSGLAELGLDCDAAAQQKLLGHLGWLERWRHKLNLTAISKPADLVILHTLDSLVVLPWVKGPKILDFGTGAGFPGLPIASVMPEVEVTLLDSRGKRMEFLRFVLPQIKVSNVNLVTSRIEQYNPEQKFDTLVARAVASLDKLLTMTAHLHAPGLRLIAMKGQLTAEELEAISLWENISCSIETLTVPELPAERHAVIIDFH